MNVLIVEDDDITTKFLTEIINRMGHTPHTAGTGKEALDILSRQSMELAFLDIFLPDGMGYELIPELRTIQPDVEIVTMTGHNTRELELKIRKYGVLLYLSKPLEVNDLKSVIDHVAKKRGGNNNDKPKRMTPKENGLFPAKKYNPA